MIILGDRKFRKIFKEAMGLLEEFHPEGYVLVKENIWICCQWDYFGYVEWLHMAVLNKENYLFAAKFAPSLVHLASHLDQPELGEKYAMWNEIDCLHRLGWENQVEYLMSTFMKEI